MSSTGDVAWAENTAEGWDWRRARARAADPASGGLTCPRFSMTAPMSNNSRWPQFSPAKDLLLSSTLSYPRVPCNRTFLKALRQRRQDCAILGLNLYLAWAVGSLKSREGTPC